MSDIQIVAVHGFLGLGTDWDLIEKCCATKAQLDWLKIDLFSTGLKSNIQEADLNSFSNLALKIDSLADQNKKKIFIGYSLGGRIGLEILKEYSEHFEHFVFLSTNPGLINETEKQERLVQDLKWKDRLTKLTWPEFLEQWLQQPVFKNDQTIHRLANLFDPKKLAFGLDQLSLGQQNEMSDVIANHRHKLTWVVGDLDSKFLHIAEALKQKKILSSYERISQSGHRILFDQPNKIADLLLQIILRQQGK